MHIFSDNLSWNSCILLDYIPYVPTKLSTIFKLASGRVLHVQKNHWESELRLAFRKLLYGTDRQNSHSCPNEQETLVEWPTLKFMACVGTLTLVVLFFSLSKNNYFCFFVLSWQVNVLFQDPGEVHGSLSVLLDTALCAISPLLFLTSQVPEMNGCSQKTQVLGFCYFNQHLVSPDDDSA